MMDISAEILNHPELGLESRSILKSISTEDTKLFQSKQLTKSDLHYFRARYNYYRLSLLRLPPEERSVLEPHLGHFLNRIAEAERIESGESVHPRVFLQAVDSRSLATSPAYSSSVPKVSDPKVLGEAAAVPAVSPASSAQAVVAAISREDCLQDLELLRLALYSHPQEEARSVLLKAVDRVISHFKN